MGAIVLGIVYAMLLLVNFIINLKRERRVSEIKKREQLNNN